MEELVIATPMGEIVVKPTHGGPDYPGVWIDLRRKGCEPDAPLAMVEFTSTEGDLEGPAIITRVWDSAMAEEYQTRVVHREIEEYFTCVKMNEEETRNA